jgi:D-alanyl-D-alanine carboxypeptidase
MNRKKAPLKARIASLVLLCALLLIFVPIDTRGETILPAFHGQISAQSAILIDADQKSVLFEKNPNEIMGEASTTKIMTALVAAEAVPLEQQITIPSAAVGVEGSSVYLCEGEILTVKELLYALLLESANDAATALAIAVAGSVEEFSKLMNSYAEKLGLENTNFCNPHGLYDEQHYTTAHDLALISARALENKDLRAIFCTKKTTISCGVTKENPEGDGVRYLQNHNKMLSRYEGAIGIKTGYTKATGRCLVSAAERDGMTLIAVTLNAPDDWNDHTAMLNYGFATYERVVVYDVGEFSHPYAVSGGVEPFAVATNSVQLALTLPKKREQMIESVEFPQRFEIAPIDKGATLGEISVRYKELEVRSPLVAANNVETPKKQKFSLFQK